MRPASADIPLDRRRFLKLSLTGAAALTVLGGGAQLAGCARPATTAAPGYGFLTTADLRLFTALLPAVNGASLPPAASLRDEALRRIDRSCIALQPPARAEVRKLLDLLHWRLFRRLSCGFSADWEQATPEQLQGFLQRWRDSRLELLNAGHRALLKLLTIGWWSQPASWPASHYPGPPAWALAAL